MLRQENNRLIREFDSEQLWIEPWGQNSLRVRVTKMRSMPQAEEEWALLPPGPQAAEITVNGSEASITNGKISAKLTAAGKLVFLNQRGQVLLEEFHRNRREAMEEFNGAASDKSVEKKPEYLRSLVSALDIEAREFNPILGGDYQLTARFESNPEEKLFGMGQYQQPFLNIKGCTLELAHRNSQASVPFLVSNLGYGFLWHNPAIGKVTFGKNVTEWVAQATGMLDYWITAGDTPAEIEETYAAATGTVPMMPEYAMGFWQCKLRYRTQEELLEVAREYKRRGLPISVIVADFFHWPNLGDWKFDLEYWPDPQGMVAELKAMGIELMVSIWPTVEESSENFKEMVEKGYLIRADRGNRLLLAGASIFDATHPGAREYVWSKVHQNYYANGIKIFWLDEAEPEYNHYHYDIYRYHLGPDVQIGNIYPLLYARTFFEGMSAAGQGQVINLLRCAWAGSQKYGALVWSGDIDTTFRSMRNQFAAGLNMGLAGIPWWTTDIGGFHGGNPDDPAYREVLARWFQYGAFCPVFRLHGLREPHMPPLSSHGGGKMLSGAANEVWSYGDAVYDICTRYMFMRERLKPYITGLMRAAHEHGTPVMRTLFYEFPADDKSWEVSDQYMFGPDLLVAPVMEAGLVQRPVYLPQGAQWINAWTGEVLAGGQTILADAPLDTIPLFLRDGVKLPILNESTLKSSGERLSVGAIRWDAWFDDKVNPYEKNLADKKWHGRLPFYAKVISDTEVQVHGDTQEAVDQEIVYARAGGLDYWAFLYYPATIRNDGFNHDHMNRARRLYLSSRFKQDLNFCLIVSPGHPDKDINEWLQIIQEPTYQKVAGGRPLIYFMMWGEEVTVEKVYGDAASARRAMDDLRRRIMATGQMNPYFVVLAMTPQAGAAACDAMGLDAISAYTSFGGPDYAGLCAAHRQRWDAMKATGKKVVPNLTAGWGGPRDGLGDTQQPNPGELSAHLRSAFAWIDANPDAAEAKTMLFYAWNEVDEGGWLVPDLGSGSAKLDTIRGVVEAAGVAHSGTWAPLTV